MGKKFKVCFVCTENIGRSLIAEQCLKLYIKEQEIKNIEVFSAGTTHTDSDISKHCFAHFEELELLGADISKHKRTPLDQEMVNKMDLIVTMAENHQRWIKEFWCLFSPVQRNHRGQEKVNPHSPSGN